MTVDRWFAAGLRRWRKLLGDSTRPPITPRQAAVIRECADVLEREHHRVAADILRAVLAELEGRG